MTAHYIKSKNFCKSNHSRGLTLLSVTIIFSIIGLIFFYLIQTNSLVSGNFEIRDYQEKIKELEVKTERLEMDIAQWQSPANLEKLVDSLEMIKVGEVTYLEKDIEMAVKK